MSGENAMFDETGLEEPMDEYPGINPLIGPCSRTSKDRRNRAKRSSGRGE